MNKKNMKNKLSYWLDKQMSKGTVSIIKMMAITVLFVVVVISLAMLALHLRDGYFSAFWDALATAINAWVPSSGDGEVGYVVLNTVTAIFGLIFTSVLFGVVGNVIEEKVNNLRRGNSVVLEKGHTVILGYNLGEHGLLRQLIESTGSRRRVIVICTDIDKPDLEDDLKNEVDIPSNIEIICRHGDITKVNELRCCSIEEASVVIINAMDDNRRVKALLTVNALKKEYPNCNVKVISCVSEKKRLLPKSMLYENNTVMVQTNSIMAKLIAHSVFDPGLSTVYKEILNFNGNEFYYEKSGKFTGRTIGELTLGMDNAIITGIKHDGWLVMNPGVSTVVEEEDELLLLEESYKSFYYNEAADYQFTLPEVMNKPKAEEADEIIIFGGNTMLEKIISELPGKVEKITIISKEENEYVQEVCEVHPEIIRVDIDSILNNRYAMEKVVRNAEHIVILANRDIDWEEADTNTILLLFKLIDIRENFNCPYNITTELVKESSINYVARDYRDDFTITSNVSSAVLAQHAENPAITDAISELLSKDGNTLLSRKIELFELDPEKEYTFRELKHLILNYGYVLFGYIHDNQIILNPRASEKITLNRKDSLILLGKR